MTLAALSIAAVGFIVAVIGALRLYRGRIREDPENPAVLIVPLATNWVDLALAIGGALLTLAGAIVGALA